MVLIKIIMYNITLHFSKIVVYYSNFSMHTFFLKVEIFTDAILAIVHVVNFCVFIYHQFIIVTLLHTTIFRPKHLRSRTIKHFSKDLTMKFFSIVFLCSSLFE